MGAWVKRLWRRQVSDLFYSAGSAHMGNYIRYGERSSEMEIGFVCVCGGGGGKRNQMNGEMWKK